MLFEVTEQPSRTAVLWSATALFGLVVGLRVLHSRLPRLHAWPYQHLEIVVFGALSLLVLLAFRWQTRAGGIVWPHFLWVCGGLALHPFTEPVYRAVVSVPGMLRAVVVPVAPRAQGG
jgi:hypothetical protein